MKIEELTDKAIFFLKRNAKNIACLATVALSLVVPSKALLEKHADERFDDYAPDPITKNEEKVSTEKVDDSITMKNSNGDNVTFSSEEKVSAERPKKQVTRTDSRYKVITMNLFGEDLTFVEDSTEKPALTLEEMDKRYRKNMRISDYDGDSFEFYSLPKECPPEEQVGNIKGNKTYCFYRLTFKSKSFYMPRIETYSDYTFLKYLDYLTKNGYNIEDYFDLEVYKERQIVTPEEQNKKIYKDAYYGGYDGESLNIIYPSAERMTIAISADGKTFGVDSNATLSEIKKKVQYKIGGLVTQNERDEMLKYIDDLMEADTVFNYSTVCRRVSRNYYERKNYRLKLKESCKDFFKINTTDEEKFFKVVGNYMSHNENFTDVFEIIEEKTETIHSDRGRPDGGIGDLTIEGTDIHVYISLSDSDLEKMDSFHSSNAPSDSGFPLVPASILAGLLLVIPVLEGIGYLRHKCII